MSRVTNCNIEDCQHNQDKTCQADGIEVDARAADKAGSVENTCCRTYKRKRL
ncbi:MAG: DUF1540 domain-containing protein [Peptococcaceae bacterium]|nr:MAG: DUF1540 domain-containing protein [Peptococcaceae bacterium]